VSTQLADSLPAVYGDSNSIQRVVINLLDNAVDACEQGGSSKISTHEIAATHQKKSGIVVNFADTGAGIDPQILPKVFDLFVTTKAPGKGTGLGLVICQEIIKAHGGTINIASRVGQGTTVTVFLPTVAVTVPKTEVIDEQPHIDC
jgi:two-component system NtrC family sensor kinase